MPFQSTRPARGATCPHGQYGRGTFYFNPRAAIRIRSRRRWYFNPRAPRGARLFATKVAPQFSAFQSTRPGWGATTSATAPTTPRSNFNPRAPRGARPRVLSDLWPLLGISIHAPHAGRDRCSPARSPARRYFNPRAPCGARLLRIVIGRRCYHFNPRAPCGARQRRRQDLRSASTISIHAPHAGRDLREVEDAKGMKTFQSTRPMRGATKQQ